MADCDCFIAGAEGWPHASGCGSVTSLPTDTTGMKIEDMVGGLPPVPDWGAAVRLAEEVSRLQDERDGLRSALEFIASGTACGPVEVARVALGLKAVPDVG